MQSSYQIRLTKLKTREEWRHVSSKSIENAKLHLDAIQATMMILFNVKVFSSTLQTSSLRLEWQQFGVCQIFQVHLMTSFTSGMVKSQKLRFHTPLSWPKSNKSKKWKNLSNHKKIFESSIWQIFIGPGSSHSEHSLPHWGKPLARVWPEHLTWRYPAIQARFGKIKPDTKCLNALKYTTSDGKLLLLIEQSEQ